MTKVVPLTRLGLRSFKAFERLDVRLKQFTLLVGTNSSGKSSVIHAIAAAHQSRESGFDGLLLNGPLVELGAYEDILFDQLASSSREAPRLELRFNSRRFRFASAATDSDVVRLESSSPRLDLPWHRLAYVRADRLSPALLHLRSSQSAIDHESVGARGEFAVHQLLRHLDDKVAENLVADRARPATVDAQAEAWIERISPGTRLAVEDIRQAGVASLRFGRQPGAGYIGGQTHRATNVGFGLAYTLPILVACLLARTGDILVVENPEAHLHPKAQTALAELCLAAAAGGVQVIVETHSDHVLNAVRLAVARSHLQPTQVAVLFFHRTQGEASPTVSPMEIDSSGQFGHWPEDFFDEYLRALLELSDHD